jgi:cysteine desulfurase/selenocysteine lyase
MDEIDVEAVRRATPGCGDAVHLNNAGASLMPACVSETVVRHMRQEADLGGYEAVEILGDQARDVYSAAARLLSCAPDEIALFENATLAWRAAILALPFEPGDKILTGRAEYTSHRMAYVEIARRAGVELLVVDNDERGELDMERVREAIDDRVRLMALTHVPTNSGVVNRVAEAGALAREAGIPFLLDACQSVGQMPVDVDEVECDFLTAAGRKFLRGPRGTGLLYVRSDVSRWLAPWMPEIGSMEPPWSTETLKPGAARFETWETSWPLRMGLGVAIDYALKIGIDRIWARIARLSQLLRAMLREQPGIEVHSAGRTECGIVTFLVDGIDSLSVKCELARRGINVDIASHWCPTGESLVADSCVVRASVHYFNTEDELRALRDALSSFAASPSRHAAA